MTELETQLLRIIEEQQQQLQQQQMQLQQQQQSLDVMQKKIIQALSAQSKAMESVQKGLVQTQKSLSTTQTQFHELEKIQRPIPNRSMAKSGDEPNYNELRGRTGENLNRTAVSLVRSSQSAAEFARNVRTIEANIVQMKELKKGMEQPQPKQDRGMNFGM